MIKVIVPVSGGKDSQACLKLALESYPKEEILGLFCDTKFEHPLTYSHIEWMKGFYRVTITTINNGSVPEIVKQFKMFPTSRIRMCTDRLKIQPSKRFYVDLAREQGEGFEVWMGMRRGESNDRAKRYKGIVGEEIYAPHEMGKSFPKYLNTKLKIWMRLPIVDWIDVDVFEYLNGEENPLYKQGSKRVGCFPCLASGDRNKERDFANGEFGAQQYALVKDLAKITNNPIFTSIGGSMRNNEMQSDIFAGCAFCAI
jgi:3'-phosphoadenosine 5'-phosphosulfate sulfotransferase (PAPS reductase)/FAD synthetase